MGRTWYDQVNSGEGAKAAFDIIARVSNGTMPPALVFDPASANYRNAWQETIKAAENANEPGRFTAFIGYEWTSQGAFNIHRNVIYRDGGDKAAQVLPFTTVAPYGSPKDSDLWKWMEAYEAKTGGDILAIPHNGNVSNGLMFPTENQPFTTSPVDKAYVEARAKWEPLYEVTQMKGDG